jgi:glutamine amidotransferase
LSSIVIVDYGMGNVRSVRKAFLKVGFPADVSGDQATIAAANRLVLPGVGAFGDAMARLTAANLVAPIRDHIAYGKPFLGICLGMQVLFTRGFEEGEHRGLDVFQGDVVRFADSAEWKVPHMGWNQLRIRTDHPFLNGIPDGAHVYFVHSYYVMTRDQEIIAAETDYAETFPSVLCSGNTVATQFHPEKSQAVGLALLRNFASEVG